MISCPTASACCFRFFTLFLAICRPSCAPRTLFIISPVLGTHFRLGRFQDLLWHRHAKVAPAEQHVEHHLDIAEPWARRAVCRLAKGNGKPGPRSRHNPHLVAIAEPVVLATLPAAIELAHLAE